MSSSLEAFQKCVAVSVEDMVWWWTWWWCWAGGWTWWSQRSFPAKLFDSDFMILWLRHPRANKSQGYLTLPPCQGRLCLSHAGTSSNFSLICLKRWQHGKTVLTLKSGSASSWNEHLWEHSRVCARLLLYPCSPSLLGFWGWHWATRGEFLGGDPHQCRQLKVSLCVQSALGSQGKSRPEFHDG